MPTFDQHHRKVGDAGIGHGRLAPGKPAGFERRAGREHGPRPFGVSKGRNHLAACQPRQPRGPLRFAAREPDRFGCKHDRAHEGDGGIGGSQGFHDDTKVEGSEPKSAMFFGNRGAKKAHVGKCPPQRLVPFGIRIDQRAQPVVR
jgi:hypothetical protein